MYILFAGNCFYPHGGSRDIKATHRDLELLKSLYGQNCREWSFEAGGTHDDGWGEICEMTEEGLVSVWTSPPSN